MLDLFVRDREIVCSNFRVRALNWIKHPSPQGLHTYFKVYSVETKSTVSIHSLM